VVDFTHLNPEQQSAVFETEGPVLVLAGAGSGKTRVITYRVAYLMKQGASASDILALSFTNKAANEIKERVLELVGPDSRAATLSTFHALGLRFLREEFSHAGLSKNFTILDEGDQIAAVASLMDDVGFDREQYDPKVIHGVMGNYKSRLERPDPRRGGADGVAAQIAPVYGQRLRALNAVDFDDLISLPVWLLENNEDIAYRWSGRFRYIMVDEYQDTNLSQLRLLQGLAKRYSNVCAVGDDDQSIYGWRGAEAGNILRFDHHFPGAKIIALTQNYRSTNRILQAANRLIIHNTNRHKKSLWSDLGDGEGLRYLEADDGEEEARWVATDLLSTQRQGGSAWSSFAILYRTNAQSRVLEEAVRSQEIPYRIVGGTRFYDRKEVRDLLGYLRVIANPWDESALRRIINFPPRGIGDQTIHKLGQHAAKTQRPFFRLVQEPEKTPGIQPRIKEALRTFHTLITEFRDRFTQPNADWGSICRDLIQKVDFRNTFSRTDSDVRRLMRRLDHLDEVAVGLTPYGERNPGSTLQDYLSMLSLDGHKEDEEDDDNVVSLMTLHSSKGLEFDHVYLVGFEEGFVPHIRMVGRNNHGPTNAPVDVTEERRLVYVGLTRAKRRLTLTGAKKRIRFGRTLVRKPSRFLYEIPDDLFSGDRSGKLPELKGEALQEKGMDAFAEMLRLVDRD